MSTCENCNRDASEQYCSNACQMEASLLADDCQLLRGMVGEVAGEDARLDFDHLNDTLFVDVRDDSLSSVGVLVQSLGTSLGGGVRQTTDENEFDTTFVVTVRV